MKKFTLLTTLIALISCSKKQGPQLTPTEMLLTSSPWKLQRSDTTHYDAAFNVTEKTSFIPADCSSQMHYIFNPDLTFGYYVSCQQPSDGKTGWKWGLLSPNHVALATGFDGQGVPGFVIADSIAVLTKDSLVTNGWATGLYSVLGPSRSVHYDHPVQIADRFTH